MIPRALLCVCLLLAGVAMAQKTAPAQSDRQSEASGAGTSLPPLRMVCKSAERASELIGQAGCVSGILHRIHVGDHHTLELSLCPRHSKCSFRAYVLRNDRKNVGDLAPLRGQLIAIVGNVARVHGHPAMRIRDRDQIHRAADDTPAERDRQHKPVRGPMHYPGSNLPIPGLKRGKSY
jgi:hypothetical protein